MSKKDKTIEVVVKEVDAEGISTENHMQMFHRLVAAGLAGIHNKPSPRQKRAH